MREKMLCVAKIDLFWSDRNPTPYHRHCDIPLALEKIVNGESVGAMVSVTTEMIHGRVFTNKRGEHVCIGLTKEVQDALGLPFDKFDDLRRRVTQLDLNVVRMKNELKPVREFRKLRWWRRVLIAGRNEL